MKTSIMFGTALLLAGLFVGCDQGRRMGRGFVFPAGDAARGQTAFVALQCNACHRVDGVPELPGPVISPEKVVMLGGKVMKVRSYGELVTAIIHPKYEISDKLAHASAYPESPMHQVNDTMTVTQLLDIVTFLQPRYQQLEPIYEYPVH
ncbi:MAG TPA: c-type cytochrome [Lacunisphaera sp.]